LFRDKITDSKVKTTQKTSRPIISLSDRSGSASSPIESRCRWPSPLEVGPVGIGCNRRELAGR
jgi:hypothetical protein